MLLQSIGPYLVSCVGYVLSINIDIKGHASVIADKHCGRMVHDFTICSTINDGNI